MRIALSGTPGTGKTACARELRRLGENVIGLNALAARRGLLGRADPRRHTREVLLGQLGRVLDRELCGGGRYFLEGHVAHLLPVDFAVVLRCSPPVLRRRLARRSYPAGKILENSLAEALDTITTESVCLLGRRRVIELDTTRRKAASVAAELARLARRGFGGAARLRPGRIDWSGEILRNAGYYSGAWGDGAVGRKR